jgi:hypothetical protein
MPSNYRRKMAERDAEDKPKSKNKSAVRHIHIEKAANGYSVSHRMAPDKDSRDGIPEEPSPSVFPDEDGVIAHVRSLMQGGTKEEE